MTGVFSGFALTRRIPRKPAKRPLQKHEPYNRVLIVCEGLKTEPLYFDKIRKRYRLSLADVVVVEKGSAANPVVETALDHQIRELNHGEKYDDVFFVFDREGHPSFDNGSFTECKNLSETYC